MKQPLTYTVSAWTYITLVLLTVVYLSSLSRAASHHHQHHSHHHQQQHHKHQQKQRRTNQKQSPENYEIVFPEIIEDESGLLVNDVSNFVKRRKRGSGYSHKPLEVSISGSGEKFRLELWENNDLVAPGFKIYHRKTLNDSAGERVGNHRVVENEIHGCHFTGNVKSHGNSPASISICNGMNGLIRTNKDDFLIEPIKEATVHGASGFVGQPHKLYKRSVLDTRQQEHFEAQNTAKQDIIIEKDALTDAEVKELEKLEEDFQNIDHKLDREIHSIEKRSLSDDYGLNLDDDSHNLERRAAYKYKFMQELNVAKTVETLVVVDKHMYHDHGDANITTYTLTLFNMLSQLFKDGSLGNKINVVLVGLILLEGDERGLSIDYNADDTLNSFCSWQSVLIGPNGRQHDHAILLTGLDLCSYKNAPCDTLGFAPMEGMCNRVRSCTVNEDTGLSTAFTIAHEVGHNFGMFHDGEGNYCTQSAGKIMSPTLMGKDGQFHWSVCSKAYLMRFLNTPQSDCLDDRPRQVAELKFPDKLPGELYNADIQCKWQFGSRARLCTYDFGKDICKALWCYRGNKRCETKFLPAAEGTSCGAGMWCRQGQCVDYGNKGPKPIDGQWSTWSEWSECSRSCGGGVITRERECSRPLPQYGGKTCEGESQIYKMCNVQECADEAEDFHSVQCATYNKQPFQGWYLQWKPQKKVHDFNEPCKLHCVADTPSYVFTIKHTATDGMSCGEDDNNICVDGTCRHVGCDWIVGSELQNDRCGVCDGDNSTCRSIKGEYLEQPELNTYFPVTILPKMARSIRIREKSLSSNYLAIRNIFGQYFLNGQQRVAWPGTYVLGGAKFKYKRPYNEPETLEADGPLQEELVLEILVQDENPGVQYEYTLPQPSSTKEEGLSTTRPDNYTWSLSVSSCSESCAGGRKSVSAICQKNFEEEVDPKFCEDLLKPATGEFPCNDHPCDPRWVTEEWSECSKTCGGGKKKRRIRCRQKISAFQDKKLKKKKCSHLPKPERVEKCNTQECPPSWHMSKWAKCSVTCGQGIQRRRVTCRSKKGHKRLPDSMCHSTKPEQKRDCEEKSCSSVKKTARLLPSCKEEHCQTRWVTGEWTTCSKACGGGVQKRRISCRNSTDEHVKNRFCKHLVKPIRKQACNVAECPVAWYMGPWSECSVTCGKGVQTRNIRCQKGERTLQDQLCTTSRPGDTKECELSPCEDVNDYQSFDWLLSPWGPCSTTCGAGTQTRFVSCVNIYGQPSDGCDESSRPYSTQSCNDGECLPTPLGQTACLDKYPWCNLVPLHKVCGDPKYSELCCKSCLTR